MFYSYQQLLSFGILLSQFVLVLASPAFLKRKHDGPIAVPMELGQTINTAEEISLKTMSIPQDIKETVEMPKWLRSWEEAEFMGFGEGYSDMYGVDFADANLRAAAYLASHTGGVWLTQTNLEDLTESQKQDIYELLLTYLKTGDQLDLAIVHNALANKK